jgi:ketosteroid isomerase-like protein
MRRLRARKGKVTELRFDEVTVRVYGASAVATYRFTKNWADRGAQRQAAGWSSDVFERRDDGAWLLVHRHRSD